MLEPIDLDFLGLRARDRRLPGRDDRRARRSSTAARRRRCRGCTQALRERGLELERHPPSAALAHPPRPRGRGRARSCASIRSSRVWVSEVGAPHLVDPSRLEASARRLYGDELRPALGRARAGARGEHRGSPTATCSAGRRSRRRATPRTTSATSATARSSPAMPAASACSPREYVLPVAPPPDIDVEAWHATIAEIAAPRAGAARADPLRRRDRRRRATSCGSATELDRWAELVRSGLDADEFASRPRREPARRTPTTLRRDRAATTSPGRGSAATGSSAASCDRLAARRAGGSGRRSTGRSTSATISSTTSGAGSVTANRTHSATSSAESGRVPS